MAGYPHLPPAANPPPKRSSPAVIIAALLLCVALALAAFAALAYGIVKVIEQSPQARATQTTSPSAVPFIGPDPWSPVRKNLDGSHRYALERIGFAIDLPEEPWADHQSYTADEAKWFTGHFNYYGQDGDKYFNIYGLRERNASDATTDHAANTFEHMFTSDDSYRPAKFARKPYELSSKKIVLFSGRYKHEGIQWFVEAAAFAHHGFVMAVGFTAERPEGLSKELMKVLRSIELRNPTDDLSGNGRQAPR